jgi:hypothetical protein
MLGGNKAEVTRVGTEVTAVSVTDKDGATTTYTIDRNKVQDKQYLDKNLEKDIQDAYALTPPPGLTPLQNVQARLGRISSSIAKPDVVLPPEGEPARDLSKPTVVNLTRKDKDGNVQIAGSVKIERGEYGEPEKVTLTYGGKVTTYTIDQDGDRQGKGLKLFEGLSSLEPKEAIKTVITEAGMRGLAKQLLELSAPPANADIRQGIKDASIPGLSYVSRKTLASDPESVVDQSRGLKNVALYQTATGQQIKVQTDREGNYHIVARGIGPGEKDQKVAVQLGDMQNTEVQATIEKVLRGLAAAPDVKSQLSALTKADVRITALRGLVIDGPELIGVNMDKARIDGCTFKGNVAVGLQAEGATFSNTKFESFRADGSRLTGSKFENGCTFEGHNVLRKSNLNGIDWGNTKTLPGAIIDASASRMQSAVAEPAPPPTWYQRAAAFFGLNGGRTEVASKLGEQMNGLVVDSNRASFGASLLSLFRNVTEAEQATYKAAGKMESATMKDSLLKSGLLERHGMELSGSGSEFVIKSTTPPNKELCKFTLLPEGKVRISASGPMTVGKEIRQTTIEGTTDAADALRSITKRLTDGEFRFKTKDPKTGDPVMAVISDREFQYRDTRATRPADLKRVDPKLKD